MNAGEIRILIADDHPIFREGLAKVISRDARLQVVAEAENGDEAFARLAELRPDVAVLDMDMPGRDGFGVIRSAQEAKLEVKIIILTSHNNEELFHTAIDLGVVGYVLKDGAINEIVSAIRAVAAGRNYFSPELSTFLLNRANRAASLGSHQPAINDLTPERYQQIGQLFDEALELAPEQRAAWLAKVCSDDARLLDDVEKLLANHSESERFLSRPALDVAAEMLAKNRTPFAPGKQISHYRILSLLGTGGMGEVYLAEDTRLDRKVAIKLLGEEFNRNEDRLRRFIREAKTASALNHPNILTVYDIGKTGSDAHFLATEYIEGETLRHHIRHSRMKIREVLDIVVQVASALSSSHQAGIVHRDIKPENLMIRPDGIVKVLDFGLAKLSEKPTTTDGAEAPARSSTETLPGIIMGTVQYMSPEQARGKEIDARTDIFSLGIVLYEMVAGRPPFSGESSTDVLAAILEKEPPPLARLADEVLQELQRIVSKCLRKERDDRYQTMKELLADLKELRDEMALKAKLERYIRPANESAAEDQPTWIGRGGVTIKQGEQKTGAATAKTVSSAEYLFSEIKNHKRGIAVTLLIVLLAALGLGYWIFWSH
jgi:serine/threonine protein kinase/DNA-binding NarL/FixJ family response regulator